MSDDPVKTLEAELDGEPIAGIEALDEAAVTHLTSAIRAARERRSQALDEGAEGALRYIPRLMRGPAKRLLFG